MRVEIPAGLLVGERGLEGCTVIIFVLILGRGFDGVDRGQTRMLKKTSRGTSKYFNGRVVTRLIICSSLYTIRRYIIQEQVCYNPFSPPLSSPGCNEVEIVFSPSS